MKFTSVLLSCLAVSLLQGGVNLLDNPEFRSLDAKGVPSGWFTHGSTVVSVKDGSLTLSLPAKKRGDQKDAAIMQHLRGKLAAGSSYVLTAVVSAPEKTAVMLYVEGWYMVGGKQKWWSSGTPRFEVGVKGAERRIVFTVPAEMLGAEDGVTVRVEAMSDGATLLTNTVFINVGAGEEIEAEADDTAEDSSTTVTEAEGGSGSSGCDAGLGLLALMAVLPALLRRTRR